MSPVARHVLLAAVAIGSAASAWADDPPPCFVVRPQDMGKLPAELYSIERFGTNEGLVDYLVSVQRTHDGHELTGVAIQQFREGKLALVATLDLMPEDSQKLRILFSLAPSEEIEVRLIAVYTIDKPCRDISELYSMRRFVISLGD